MTAANFTACLAETLSWEGGWVDHPKDPGGATMKGVTIGVFKVYKGRPVTKTELRNISQADLRAIYRRNYWTVVRGDDLPAGLDLVTFDAAVNSGPARGPKWTQRALGVEDDGRVGPNTIKAAKSRPDQVGVIKRACAARMGFLQGLRTWGTFGRGWTRRVAGIEARAVAMSTESVMAVQAEAKRASTAAKSQGGGIAAGGAGGLTGWDQLAGAPAAVTWGVIAVAIAVALVLASKAIVNSDRVAAYRRVAEEMLK
jgi:lysozyme family protein